jgi:hypothetical protein
MIIIQACWINNKYNSLKILNVLKMLSAVMKKTMTMGYSKNNCSDHHHTTTYSDLSPS